jgi:3D (Asp-Asp-Asp) domain-containing protein
MVAVPTRTVQADRSLAAADEAKPVSRVLRRVYRVTAYNDRGLTAAGVWSGIGQCAAPAGIPFGTKVHIPAIGRTLVVTDRTHRRFRTNTVDIFMPGYEQCRQFGRRYLECVVELPTQCYEYGSPELESLVREVGARL